MAVARIIDNPCKTCNGSGQVRKPATVGINIPAGIDDGQVITIRGQRQRRQQRRPSR